MKTPDWADPRVVAIARALQRSDKSEDYGEIDPLLAQAMQGAAVVNLDLPGGKTEKYDGNQINKSLKSSGIPFLTSLEEPGNAATYSAPISKGADTSSTEVLAVQLERIVECFSQIRVILPIYPHTEPARTDFSYHEGTEPPGCPPGALPQIPLLPGKRGLSGPQVTPVYSDLDTFLAAKLGEARPVPVNGRGLALLALESPGRLLLNHHWLLPRPALSAIGTGGKWLPAWKDQQLLTGITQAAEAINEQLSGSGGMEICGLTPTVAGPDQLRIKLSGVAGQSPLYLAQLQQKITTLPTFETQTDCLMITPIPV